MNKICIYAICKNEIQFVDKWLDSMSEADYIVVLDTGSTDGTFEKLQKDPRVTRVVQKTITPWRFDVARNESLKLVPNDANILFSTDLDEILEPGWGNLIRNNWTEDTWRGHYRYIWSHTDTGAPGSAFWYDKMHKPGYEWVYPVHEVLLPIDGGEEVVFTTEKEHILDFGDSIVLHHYPDQNKSRSSYLGLLKLRVDQHQQEAYSHFLLGREYGSIGMYEESKKEFLLTLSLPDVEYKPLVKYCSLGYLGDLFIIDKNYETAIMYYNQQLLIDNTYREPYLNLADIYNYFGFYEIAVSFVNTAMQKAFQHFDWTERDKAWNAQPYDTLSIAYYNLGDVDLSIDCALKALEFDPLNQRIQQNYLAFLNKKRQLENIKKGV